MVFKNISRGLLVSTILSSSFSIIIIVFSVYHHLTVLSQLQNNNKVQ